MFRRFRLPRGTDSEYGWEKLFSERLFLSYNKNFDIPVRIARFHNIFSPEGTFDGGREKAPAAMCRKVAKSKIMKSRYGEMESRLDLLYIDECLEATRRLMNSKFIGPINIGSEEMVSINQLVKIVADVAKKVSLLNTLMDLLGWVETQTIISLEKN